MYHLLLLCISFLCLGLWHINPERKALIYPSIFALILANFKFGIADQGMLDMMLHISFDLILISSLLFIFQIIKHSKYAFPILIVFSIVLFKTHGLFNNKSIQSIDKESIPELLMLFENQSAKQQFLKKNKDYVQIQYPAFQLQDHNIGDLEEYLAVDIYDDIDVHKFKQKVEHFDGLIWMEENQQIELPSLQEPTWNTSKKVSGFNDPLSDQQWQTNIFSLSDMHQKIENSKTPKAHESVVVILDTGIDANHEDLKARYQSSGTASYDKDRRGHGTHCAGIAAAVSNNSLGIASILPENSKVKVMSIQVLNNIGFGSQRTIINGILEAADLGAEVISLSLGGLTTESRERAYTEAIEYANSKGAIVVVAAGNSGKNAKDYSPANTEGVIAVTAIDSTLQLATFANSVVDLKYGIAAPGVDILSTFPENTYKRYSGTSMAAPFVAGMVGILKSYYPNENTQQIYLRLTQSGQSVAEDATPIIWPIQIVDEL